MKNIIIGLALIALAILLIMKFNKPSVQGEWIAEHVIDNQSDTLQIDASVIQLNINEERYTFTSTLNREEEGTIRRKGDHLIVQNEGAEPYKMDITHLTESDLVLTMLVEDTPRKIFMKRHIR